MHPGSRAGEMGLSGNYTNTVTHELGHMFENYRSTPISETARRKRLRKTVTGFRDSRTSGEASKWLGPGYGENEVGWRDKFFSSYVGREYTHDSTEIFSMGMESFSSGASWGVDKEMDELIIGILLCL